MPEFSYKAVSAHNEKKMGTIDAPSRKHANQLLRKEGLTVLTIAQINEKHRVRIDKKQHAPRPQKPKSARRALFARKSGVGLSFLSKLLDLHKNGLQIPDCIQLIRQRVSDPAIQDIAHSVWKDLSEGLLLDKALGKMPQYFNTPTLRLLEAGERTSNLSPILENIVEYLEEKEAIRKKILSGLAYPILVCCVTLILASGFLFFLLPRIKDMIDSLGGEMNLITSFLIGFGEWSIRLGPFMFTGAFLLFLIFRQWRKTPNGKWVTDRWALRIPLLGQIFNKSELYQFTNLLATLFESGITATEGLRLTEKTLNNQVLLDKLHRSRLEINEGHSFSDSFRKHDFFPDSILDILTIGESVGNLVKSLRDVNARLRSELTAHMQVLTVSITAIALGSAFILVGLTAVGMVMSIFQVGQSLQGK